mgnify:CR=1 FL=1
MRGLTRRFSMTSTLSLQTDIRKIQTFRVMDNQGKLLDKNQKFSSEEVDIFKKIYRKMNEVEKIDNVLLSKQRNGVISFYMTSYGETGFILGTAAAMNPNDMIFSQYREMAALYWRGFTIKQITDNCTCNKFDQNKGRQMPIHFSSSKHSFFSISSPLATQLSQASGYGFGLRTKKDPTIAVAYTGEGAASEGDFYAALNFAQTLKSKTLFLCRNNQFAISTPIEEQTSGDNILPKAMSFGMKSLRVDGNDAVATYLASKFMRKLIDEEGKPGFIEGLTYRISDHSTSDDSKRYRSEQSINTWKTTNNPISRLRSFLLGQEMMTAQEDKLMTQDFEQIEEKTRKMLSESSEKDLSFGSFEELFEDVYSHPTSNLIAQKKNLMDHVSRHKEEYEKLIH